MELAGKESMEEAFTRIGPRLKALVDRETEPKVLASAYAAWAMAAGVEPESSETGEEEPEEEDTEEEEQGQEQDEDGEPAEEASPLSPGPGGALPPPPPPPPDTSGTTAVGSSTDDGEVPTLRATMVVTGTDKTRHIKSIPYCEGVSNFITTTQPNLHFALKLT